MNPFKLLGIIDSLLIPIQRSLGLVLPDFFEDKLEDPAVRENVVAAADKALIKAQPEARLVPGKVRRRLIGKLLDIMLDDILLPD